MAPPDAARRDRSPQAVYAHEQPRPIQTLRRSSTLSTLADETDTLYESGSEDSSNSKNDGGQSHRGSWFARIWTAIVLATSIYSTTLSGLWFVLAVTSHQYDIGHKHAMSFSDVSTIVAALAKTIELSFELVSVAVVGQELTRRLTTRSCNGINLAQMQLKAFLAQPGSMITNWQAFFHVAPTFLGVTAVFIGAIGTLYTTASDALVAPTATMISMGVQSIPADVNTGFLNTTYMQSSCPSQVDLDQDPAALSTCNDVQQTGSVFRDLMTYLNNFQETVGEKHKDLSILHHRPGPLGQFNDMYSVRGEWLQDPQNANASVVFQKNGRTVNNVTMLLPHAGVVAAAIKYGRQILPQDQNGAGQVQLSASVSTPAINVQCASFDDNDPTLAAIVVPEWSAAQNSSLKPNMQAVLNTTDQSVKAGWYNGTAFDSLWQFSSRRRPPVFPNLPGPNNTRISWSKTTNGTAYLLGRAPNQELFMCAMTAVLAHNCSTKYSSSMTGGQLSLDCSSDNELAYTSTQKPAPALLGFVPAMNAWSLSLGLGSSTDVDGSLVRMLAQLWPSSGLWNTNKPSLAEALAVLSGSVVLNGAVGAPLADTDQQGLPLPAKPTEVAAAAAATITASVFVPDAASATAISMGAAATSAADDEPVDATSFQAQVQVSVYAAGSNSRGQLGFFVVLMGAWFVNSIFFFYLIGTIIARRRSKTEDLGADAEGAGTWTLRADLADPQALFGLALNSRPDERLADPTLATLPRKAMSQRWRVAGSNYSVYIHPIGPRRSPLRRVMSSALGSTVGSITRKNSGLRKEHIIREKEIQ